MSSVLAAGASSSSWLTRSTIFQRHSERHQLLKNRPPAASQVLAKVTGKTLQSPASTSAKCGTVTVENISSTWVTFHKTSLVTSSTSSWTGIVAGVVMLGASFAPNTSTRRQSYLSATPLLRAILPFLVPEIRLVE